MPSYNFTEQEVNVLIGFIDAGIKVGGLNAANNGLAMANKLSAGLKPAKPSTPEVKA